MPITRVELKYCEGCGALRLRSAENTNEHASAYCPSCARLLAPPPSRRQPEGGRQ